MDSYCDSSLLFSIWLFDYSTILLFYLLAHRRSSSLGQQKKQATTVSPHTTLPSSSTSSSPSSSSSPMTVHQQMTLSHSSQVSSIPTRAVFNNPYPGLFPAFPGGSSNFGLFGWIPTPLIPQASSLTATAQGFSSPSPADSGQKDWSTAAARRRPSPSGSPLS